MDAQTIRSILGVVGLGMAGFVVQCEAKTTNWVWTNNTDATSAAAAADWNDANNWDNGVPGEGDTAKFDKAVNLGTLATPFERYIRIPEEGVTVEIIQSAGMQDLIYVKFLGGPIRGLKSVNGGSTACSYTFDRRQPLMFFNALEGTDAVSYWTFNVCGSWSATIGWTGWGSKVDDVYRGPQPIMGRMANAPAPDVIVNPFPTNINSFSVLGVMPREAQTISDCVLTKGSKFVFCSINALAKLTAGSMVSCPGLLPEGTYLKAIYAKDCFELSEAALESSQGAALGFAEYKPAVYQRLNFESLRDMTAPASRCQYYINAFGPFTIELEKGLPRGFSNVLITRYAYNITVPESGVSVLRTEYANAKLIVPLSEDFAGTLAANFTQLVFPTNAQGRAGLSLNQNSRLQSDNNGGNVGFCVPEVVETEPIALIDNSGSFYAKTGSGIISLVLWNSAIKFDLTEGGICIGHEQDVDEVSLTLRTTCAEAILIAQRCAKLTITSTDTTEYGTPGLPVLGRIEARAGSRFSLVDSTYRKGVYKVRNVVLDEGATLSFNSKLEGTAVTAEKLVIGGRASADGAVATLDAALALTDGIEVKLDKARPIPGKVVVALTASSQSVPTQIPSGGVIHIDNRGGHVPNGTYEILEVSGGKVPSDGKWICEPTVEGQKFSAKVVDGKLMLTAKGNGMILMLR